MHMDAHGDTFGRPDRGLLGEFLTMAIDRDPRGLSINSVGDMEGTPSRPIVTRVANGDPHAKTGVRQWRRISEYGFGWSPEALEVAAVGDWERLPELGVPDSLVQWLRRRVTENPHSPGSTRNAGTG